MELLREKYVTIRKERQCGLCLNVIAIGEKMKCQTIKDDDIYNFYTCWACDEIIKHIDYNDDELCEGYVADIMSDNNFNGTPEEFLKTL